MQYLWVYHNIRWMNLNGEREIIHLYYFRSYATLTTNLTPQGSRVNTLDVSYLQKHYYQ